MAQKRASEEQLMQGVQGCKYREGAVRREWGSFPNSSGEEKGFLWFRDQGIVGKGRRFHQSFSGDFAVGFGCR